MVLVSSGGVLTGSVVSLDAAYRIGYDRRGPYVEQIDQGAFPEHDCAKEVAPQALAPVPDTPSTAADDGTTLEVLVVYTPTARVKAGGMASIVSLINLAVTETNQGYANSSVTPRVHLAGTSEVNYTETDINTDLYRLSNFDGQKTLVDGYMEEVHTLRDTYAADLVVLIGEGYAIERRVRNRLADVRE